MKKIYRNLIAVMMILSCMFVPTIKVSANEVDLYQEALNQINEEYNLELGYIPFDSELITVERYEQMVEELAISQRATLDYIDMRIKDSAIHTSNLSSSKLAMMHEKELVNSSSRSIYTVTKTKNASNLSGGVITVTYKKNTSTNTIGSVSYVLGKTTYEYTSVTNQSFKQSSWSATSLDQGETLAINSVGKMYLLGAIPVSNVTLYAEFYY